MANEAVAAKVVHDIEYKVLGNACGLLVALSGLLAGAMVTNFSLEYWREDIVQLVLTAFMGVRLLRNVIDAMTAFQAPLPAHPPRRPEVHENEYVQAEGAAVGQIPAVSSYTEEQVLDAVAKRIEAQKAEAAKKSKFGN